VELGDDDHEPDVAAGRSALERRKYDIAVVLGFS